MPVSLALCSLQLVASVTQGAASVEHDDARGAMMRRLQAFGFKEAAFCGISGLAKEELFFSQGTDPEEHCTKLCRDDAACVSYELAFVEHQKIRCRTFNKLIANSDNAAPEAFRGACLVKKSALPESTAEVQAGLKVTSQLKRASILSATGAFSMLRSVSVIEIKDDITVTAVEGFAELVSVDGDVTIAGLDSLQTVKFEKLTEIRGDLIISGNAITMGKFTSIAFPVLERIGGRLMIMGNGPNLCTIDFPLLRAVGGYIEISDDRKFNLNVRDDCKLIFPELTSVSGNNDAISTKAPNFFMDTSMSVEITGMNQLCIISMNKLGSLMDGHLKLYKGENLKTVSFHALTSAQGITLSSFPLLATLMFPALTKVSHQLALESLPLLPHLSGFHNLGRVGYLSLADMGAARGGVGTALCANCGPLSSFDGLRELKSAEYGILIIGQGSPFSTAGLDGLMNIGESPVTAPVYNLDVVEHPPSQGPSGIVVCECKSPNLTPMMSALVKLQGGFTYHSSCNGALYDLPAELFVPGDSVKNTA